jgi:demethylmenaquinone methyltransferase/2-methoxy-6-polyprenyl-1,4-benzoquinol methylase
MSSSTASTAATPASKPTPPFDPSPAGWDRVAQQNAKESESITGPHAQRIIDHLKEKLPTGGKAVLADIACGGGAVTLRAAKLPDTFGEIIASDHASAFLEILNREVAELARNGKTVPVRTQVGDALKLSGIPDNSVDAAVSTFGAMILPNPRVAFEELVRITKPGGYIGVTAWAAPPHTQFHSLWGAVSRHVAGKLAEKAAAAGETVTQLQLTSAVPQMQVNTIEAFQSLFSSLGLQEELLVHHTSTSRVFNGVADFWINTNKAMPVRPKTDEENRWAIEFLSGLFGEHATFSTSFTGIVAIARKPL